MTPKIEPISVAEFADSNDVSVSTVRRWIGFGYLIVDKKERPMKIVGGEKPFQLASLKARLSDATQKLKPSLYGWGDDGNLHVLVAGKIEVVESTDHWKLVPAMARQIERLAMAQGGAS